MIGLMCPIYFLQVNFKFKIKVCNGCHDLMQKAMTFIDVAIASVRRIIIKFVFGIWVRWSHQSIRKCLSEWESETL